MNNPGKILVTGAAGFIGVALCRYLRRNKLSFRAVVRRGGRPLPADLQVDLGDIVAVPENAEADLWEDVLVGVETVIHLAARAHQDGSRRELTDQFFRDNLDMSRALAQGAVKAGVRRFLLLSSIKVNGEGSLASEYLVPGERGSCSPQGAYAVSKWRAEQELGRICASSKNLDLQIIRIPLVYGPGVKGNFATLLGWLARGWPLLLPPQGNQRSFIYVENLVDFIAFLLSHPDVGATLTMPADREDCSTEKMATTLSRQLGRSFRGYRVPLACLQAGARLLQRPEVIVKMFGSLQVDRRAINKLGWRAPYPADVGLAETVSWWRQRKNGAQV